MRALVMLLLLLAGVLACRRTADVYPPEIVRNFMTTCTTRSSERVCRCAIDALQQRYTLDEFTRFETRMRSGEVPKEMMDAVAGCRA